MSNHNDEKDCSVSHTDDQTLQIQLSNLNQLSQPLYRSNYYAAIMGNDVRTLQLLLRQITDFRNGMEHNGLFDETLCQELLSIVNQTDTFLNSTGRLLTECLAQIINSFDSAISEKIPALKKLCETNSFVKQASRKWAKSQDTEPRISYPFSVQIIIQEKGTEKLYALDRETVTDLEFRNMSDGRQEFTDFFAIPKISENFQNLQTLLIARPTVITFMIPDGSNVVFSETAPSEGTYVFLYNGADMGRIRGEPVFVGPFENRSEAKGWKMSFPRNESWQKKQTILTLAKGEKVITRIKNIEHLNDILTNKQSKTQNPEVDDLVKDILDLAHNQLGMTGTTITILRDKIFKGKTDVEICGNLRALAIMCDKKFQKYN